MSTVAWLEHDGLVRFLAHDGTDPTDWASEEVRHVAKELLVCAAHAVDGPSRPMLRDERGIFSLGADGPCAFNCVGAIGVRSVSADGGPCLLTATEARQLAAALTILADEEDAR